MHVFQDHSEEKVFIQGPVGNLETKISGFLQENSEVSFAKNTNIGIICHPHPLYQGTMDNKVVTTVIRAWQELGFSTIRFNFRGVGQSAGEYGHGIGEKEDLKAVLTWVFNKTQKQEKIKIFLAGFSFGSVISAEVAGEWQEWQPSAPELSGLISLAPIVEFLSFPPDKIPLCPWLLIHGEKDEIVDVEAVNTWFKKRQENNSQSAAKNTRFELVVLPEASHFFHHKLIDLKKIIQAFIRSL